MVWHFTGYVTSKQISPNSDPQYYLELKSWECMDELLGNLHNLIVSSQRSAAIVPIDAARDGLLNLMKKGEAALSQSKGASEISYIAYAHDPSAAADHSFLVTVGLDPARLREISANLDEALFQGNPIQITGSAKFSPSPGHPTFVQPTVESVEIGEALKFSDPVKIVIHSKPRLQP